MDCNLPGSSIHGISQALPSPRDLPNPGVGPMSPAWTVGSFTTEQPGKPALIFAHVQLWNVMLMIFWGGGGGRIQAGQRAPMLRSHSGPTSIPSPKYLVGFLCNGHFFSKTLSIYFKLISSLACPPPLQLPFPHPYNFTTLNYKQVINLVDPPVSDFCVVSRTRPGKIDWVSGFLGQHSPLCSFCPSGVHPFGSPYHLDFDLVTNMRLQLPNYWRRRSGLKRQKRNFEGSFERKEYKLMVKRRFSFSGKSQNCLNCCKAISWF